MSDLYLVVDTASGDDKIVGAYHTHNEAEALVGNNPSLRIQGANFDDPQLGDVDLPGKAYALHIDADNNVVPIETLGFPLSFANLTARGFRVQLWAQLATDDETQLDVIIYCNHDQIARQMLSDVINNATMRRFGLERA